MSMPIPAIGLMLQDSPSLVSSDFMEHSIGNIPIMGMEPTTDTPSARQIMNGMPLQLIIMGFPHAIIDCMIARQLSSSMSMLTGSIGINVQRTPSGVISLRILHAILGLAAIIGIIMGIGAIMGIAPMGGIGMGIPTAVGCFMAGIMAVLPEKWLAVSSVIFTKRLLAYSFCAAKYNRRPPIRGLSASHSTGTDLCPLRQKSLPSHFARKRH